MFKFSSSKRKISHVNGTLSVRVLVWHSQVFAYHEAELCLTLGAGNGNCANTGVQALCHRITALYKSVSWQRNKLCLNTWLVSS